MTDMFVPTSVARRLIARMRVTHERRRISIFAGPPGIGKTTAIDVLRKQLPNEIAVVKIARHNAKEVLALQHALEAIRALSGSSLEHFSTSIWELRKSLFNSICEWAGADPYAAKRHGYDVNQFPRLTVVFDEAQNLAREAIEALRYWNDTDRCYSPFPLGLVFVGNSEFSLRSGADGRNVISAAVADRALYAQVLEQDELTDEDIGLFLEARGMQDRGSRQTVLRWLRTARAPRSLRRVRDLVDELADLADGVAITPELVRRCTSGA